jgi:glycosyltransferase involved in cell wall biosynthesis
MGARAAGKLSTRGGEYEVSKPAPSEGAIVYRFLPQWRVAFFDGLRDALAARNIRLRLYYGKNPPETNGRARPTRLKWGNEVDLDWATPIRNRLWNVRKYELIWQQLPSEVFNADLIILMQENSLLSNYTAGLRATLSGKKTAFWGHGVNHQENAASIGNMVKRLYSTHVDWWFAYTQTVADQLTHIGFPADHITVVDNAIDTAELIAAAQRVTPQQLDDLRKDLNLGNGPIAIYCGAMYREKRIEFLTQACDRIRRQISGFEMLFLGTGSDASIVKQFTESRPWAHYVGPRYGSDRVPYFLISDVFLMPGVVGLAVLDSFALGTPLLTTKLPNHGPEIEYLQPGVDGIVSDDSLDAYVSAVVDVLGSRELQECMKQGCLRKSQRYTTANMVGRFASGIFAALDVN